MNFDVVAHVPPYKRIELHPVRKPEPLEPVNPRAEHTRRAEADRIWAITRQTAEGCNPPKKHGTT